MSQPLENYLRTYRRRAGLSQEEVGLLLGWASGVHISEYERTARRPDLETIFFYEVLLGVPASELFRGVFQKVEKETRKRAQLLAEELRKAEPGRATTRKLSILEAIIAPRATKPDNHS
jgi:transcriptional regulator with XRE-family HTH domain